MFSGKKSAMSPAGDRRSSATFIVIMAGLSSQSLLFSIPPPALPHLAVLLGARGIFVAQMLFVLPSLGLMLTGLISGWLIFKLGLRRSLLLSLLGYGLSGIIPCVTVDIFALLSSRLLLGIACAVLSTSCTMLLAQTYTGEARARMLGYQSGMGSVAGVVALVLAGSITGRLGWHAAFALYGLCTLPILLIVGLSIQAAPPQAIQAAPPQALRTVPPQATLVKAEMQGSVLSVLRLLWPVYLASCLLFTIPMASGGALPFVLQARGVTAAFTQSLVICTFTLCAAAGAFLYGRLRRRLGTWASFALGVGLSGGGMVLIGIASPLSMTALGNGIAGLGLGLFIPHLWSVTTDAAPEPLRGRAVGFLNSAMSLGGFTSSFIIGGLNLGFGRAGAFTAIGVVTLMFAAGLVFLRRTTLCGAPAPA